MIHSPERQLSASVCSPGPWSEHEHQRNVVGSVFPSEWCSWQTPTPPGAPAYMCGQLSSYSLLVCYAGCNTQAFAEFVL